MLKMFEESLKEGFWKMLRRNYCIVAMTIAISTAIA